MPYCSRCGLEVPEETGHCPRCGTEIKQEIRRVYHRSTTGHILHAVKIARENPLVFVPSLIGSILSILGGIILESWDVYRGFYDDLLDYMYAQSGVLPVSYSSSSFSFDWSLLVSWVPLALLVLSLISWLSYLASYDLGWMALNGEKPDVLSSYRHIASNIFRFVLGGVYSLVFVSVALFLFLLLMIGSAFIGISLAAVIGFILSLNLLATIVMASPTFLIMVIENLRFTPALKSSFQFTSRSLGPYLTLILLMGVLSLIFSWIIPYGGYLSFLVTVLADLSIMGLYAQTKEENTI